MALDNETINQEVLHNNKEIYARIEQELLSAEFEILVASSWFTDDELFEILEKKLKEGVRVDLIISDNQENEKLDFPGLVLKGASVTKVKNVGYGTMHQKFCIIDKKIVLHGSYNWSLNAKKNNHESIIVTNHRGTIESLVINFLDIKQKALDQKVEGNNSRKFEPTVDYVPVKIPVITKPEYERLLDTMIAAEVSAFDRAFLHKQGYERSQSNNGDHQVLNKALDTLYSGFINDIDVVEDKKRRLLSKIDEQKTRTINLLKEENTIQLSTYEIEFDKNKENFSNLITSLKAQIDQNKNAISDIKDNKIADNVIAIEGIEKDIKEAEREFIKPAYKYFDLITVCIIGFFLLVYLFLFYSSAAYILLYSVNDTAIAKQKGIHTNQVAEIYESNAIIKAIDHGGSAVLIIILFSFIPISLSLISRLGKNRDKTLLINILSLIGIIIVDFAIAYNVAESIYAVNKLRGLVIKPWEFKMAFAESNFWLVFIFGTLGLMLFKVCFEKLNSIFDGRDPDIAAQRNQLLILHKRDECRLIQEKINMFKSDIEVLTMNNIQFDADIKIKNSELENLPIKKAYQLQNKATELGVKIQAIESTTIIYKTHVENDNVPISVDALRDRINVFLEGWNDFLHVEYSIFKATEKSKKAIEMAVNWE